MLERIDQTVDFLSSHMASRPDVGMITGTGLGGLTAGMTADSRIPYEEIPHFPRSTVEGHGGRLVVGQISGKPILAMEGRFHLYEGYGPREVAFPVMVMARLGIRYLLISSAVGGLNPQFEQGDLMVVTDHINLTGTSPLVGPNHDALGPRFPDMSRVYDRDLAQLAADIALERRMLLRRGVYAGVLGPNLETPAETRFLRTIGADAVGMSTVTEAIAGAHCGLKILAIVVITNMNLPDCMTETSIEHVLAASGEAAPRLTELWEAIIGMMP
ncbi:MAG: purine-nucleoside phosphorylase [Deltaproteobacteria bacterium]|nr:purine-nucleoside phosphorylase [Deltaproteobacteria bacterium]